MKLDEAIKHAEEVAEEQEKMAKEWHENQVRKCELFRFAEMDYTHENECKECAEQHRQLAEWLKELKSYKEQTNRIITELEKIAESIREIKGDNKYVVSDYMYGLYKAFSIVENTIADRIAELKGEKE